MRILMLDDRAPHPHLGSGYPRAHAILAALSAMGHKIEFIPCVHAETKKQAAPALPPRCKYLPLTNLSDIIAYVAKNPHRFDALWVSRPHNMAQLQRYLPEEHPVWKSYPLVIYDAEAIFALRTRLMKNFYPNTPVGRSLSAELGLTNVADVVSVVSPTEQALFTKRGRKAVVLSAALTCDPSTAEYSDRRGFLFVGALRDHPSPNSDALIWFCKTVAPLLRSKLGDDFHLSVAGMTEAPAINTLADDDITLLGMVPDLKPLYNSSRVFIAPHRFAAGIPLKVLEASAYGLPAVTSELLAEQLKWTHGRELLCAATDTPREFADACIELYTQADVWRAVQSNTTGSIQHEFSTQSLNNALHSILETSRG